MSDPRYADRDPRMPERDPRDADNSPRRLQGDESGSGVIWVIGAVAAAVVVGMLAFGMSDSNRTANMPVPQTTGQGTRPPASPAPTTSPAPLSGAPSTPSMPSPGPATNP
jgi:hypothetical protein